MTHQTPLRMLAAALCVAAVVVTFLAAGRVMSAQAPVIASSTLYDVQVWENPPGVPPRHQHIGVDIGVPLLTGTVSGVVTMKLRIETFLFTGTISRLEAQIGNDRIALNAEDLPLTPATADHHEPQWLEYLFDTTKLANDGAQPVVVQIELKLEDRSRRLARIRACIIVKNGKPDNGEACPKIIADGWIKVMRDGVLVNSHGYVNVTLNRAFLPPATLTGLWQPKVLFSNSKSDIPVRAFAAIDPRVHEGITGTVLLDAPRTEVAVFTIDPATLLAGQHKVMFRSSDEGTFTDGVVQAVLVVPFLVGSK